MKAVIVEIKDGYAAVLSDEGCILKVKNNNYEIGQEITMDQKKVVITKKLAVMAASAAMFVTLCGVGTWAYASPYSYVSLDVNPSIEYTINRFDRVIDVNAVNDDGSDILDLVNVEQLENKTIQDALDQTIEQIADEGYFDGETEGGIVIATSGKDPEKAEELAEELQQSATQTISEHGDEVQIETISVGLERVEEAHTLGVTPGKLNLIEKLQASAADPDSIKIEDWLNKPVKEIMKATKDNKKLGKNASPDETIVEDETITDSNEDLVEDSTQDIKEDDKNIDKAEKEAEKNAEKQNKADEKKKDKAEKEDKKQKDQAEKDAKKQQDQADKDVKKQQEQTDKDIKKQQEQADNDVKKQQEQADKDVKNNGKNDKSVKDQTDPGSDDRNNQSDKEQSESDKDDSQNNNSNNNSQSDDNGKNNNSKGKNNG
ncbi:MAG: hypothetical protein K0S47_1545 [Herbinix sp.]|jgi:hypothetical protein|nr:hypothetical protein [Herbinix sp.]